MKYHGHCAYCGRPLKMKAMTVDLLVPKSKGGGNSIENLMPSLRDIKFSNHNEVGWVRRETRPIYILLIIRQY